MNASAPGGMALPPEISSVLSIDSLLNRRSRGRSLDHVWSSKGLLTNEGIVEMHDKVSCPEGRYRDTSDLAAMDALKDDTNELLKQASRIPQAMRIKALFCAAARFAKRFQAIAPFEQGNLHTIEAVVSSIMEPGLGFFMAIDNKEEFLELLKAAGEDAIVSFLARTASTDTNPGGTGEALRCLKKAIELLENGKVQEADYKVSEGLQHSPSSGECLHRLYLARYTAKVALGDLEGAAVALAKADKHSK